LNSGDSLNQVAFFHKLIRRIKKWGSLHGTKWMLGRILQKIVGWECLIFFRRDLNRQPVVTSSKIDVHFYLAAPIELKQFAYAEKISNQEHLQDLESGAECVIGKYQNKIVYSAWINFHRIYEAGLFNWSLTPPQAYLYRVFTGPEYRGFNIATAGYQFIFQHLQRRHIHQCFVATNFENYASIRSIEKSGFSRFGKIHFIKFRNHRFTLFENVNSRLRR